MRRSVVVARPRAPPVAAGRRPRLVLAPRAAVAAPPQAAPRKPHAIARVGRAYTPKQIAIKPRLLGEGVFSSVFEVGTVSGGQAWVATGTCSRLTIEPRQQLARTAAAAAAAFVATGAHVDPPVRETQHAWPRTARTTTGVWLPLQGTLDVNGTQECVVLKRVKPDVEVRRQ